MGPIQEYNPLRKHPYGYNSQGDLHQRGKTSRRVSTMSSQEGAPA